MAKGSNDTALIPRLMILWLVPEEFFQPWFLLGACRTTNMWLGHIDQVFAAEGSHFNMPVQTKKALFNRGLQDKIGTAVCPENARNGAVGTVLGLPVR